MTFRYLYWEEKVSERKLQEEDLHPEGTQYTFMLDRKVKDRL